VLIVGCGDVGQRIVPWLKGRVQVLALTSSADRVPLLRTSGVVPLLGNLDRPGTLGRLAGLAHRVIHLAPPPGGAEGAVDARTRALLLALRLRSRPEVLVYGSTSGVYGDCAGDWVAETRTLAPITARAARRVDAEDQLRAWGRSTLLRVNVLRIPGIYAPDRIEGMPTPRLRQGTPVLVAEDDVYTNHIHADDLARACVAAMWRGTAQRTFNVNDDSMLKMGDYFDLAADLLALPRPPRLTRAEAMTQISPLRMSFMSESRRMDNTRMKRELRVRLDYSSVHSGLVSKPHLAEKPL
jgi:nucleoside-diphosphate-sugar epimerase